MASATHQQDNMEIRVAIMKFEDRNRYGQNGVPTNILFGGGKKCIVVCKSPHKINHWAKIKISKAFFDGDDSQRGELVELWGPVGEYANELKAYQWHFGVLPCKYPPEAEWKLDAMESLSVDVQGMTMGKEGNSENEGLTTMMQKRGDYRHLADFTFSVDNVDTRDVDDALSVEFMEGGNVRLGIHIADVASRVPVNSSLFLWAKERVSSAYHGGVNEDDHGSVPMLPPQLAHGELSLNQVSF
jgi:exoribonuclease R